MTLRVVQPGILSLLQDGGRIGRHRLGLANGGPMDREAYSYCNRLLGNGENTTVVEISVGGLQLEAQTHTHICVTGADMPLSINGKEQARWRVLEVQPGDNIALEFARRGCRAYLGVAQGFEVAPVFDSTATVVREQLGGLHGGPLQAGDRLPCPPAPEHRTLQLPARLQPRYPNTLTVRVVPGYQQHAFSREQQRRFFGGPYTVTDRCDRMGYRLEGTAVHSEIGEMLSEGICHGAIQLPPDGQPIVLLNDRQTIGGYPKIGTALSVDTWRLSQLVPGNTVYFAPITVGTAQKAMRLTRRFALSHPLREC